MVAIIKYNAGNIRSVQNALNRLGVESKITDDPEEILSADKVIFPGVGEASSAMSYLRERGLDEVIRSLKQPVLGVCLGMQLLCASSEEGEVSCLGIFDTNVRKFPENLRVPHMGWNNFEKVNGSLFDQLEKEDDMYFVHSYYVEQNEQSIALCNYGLSFSVAIQKDNFYGVQFHPEKSAKNGEQILKNFLAL